MVSLGQVARFAAAIEIRRVRMPRLEQAARPSSLLLSCRGDSGGFRQNPPDEIAMHTGHQGYANVRRPLPAWTLARKPFARGVNKDSPQQAFRLWAGNAELQKKLDQRFDRGHRRARQRGLA